MAAVIFTIVVLVVFFGAIAYTAHCARAAVAAEAEALVPDDAAVAHDVAPVRAATAALHDVRRAA